MEGVWTICTPYLNKKKNVMLVSPLHSRVQTEFNTSSDLGGNVSITETKARAPCVDLQEHRHAPILPVLCCGCTVLFFGPLGWLTHQSLQNSLSEPPSSHTVISHNIIERKSLIQQGVPCLIPQQPLKTRSQPVPSVPVGQSSSAVAALLSWLTTE